MIGMAVVGCLVGVVLTGALGLRMVRSAGTGQAASPDEVVDDPDSRWDDLVYREQAIQQARAVAKILPGWAWVSKEQHRVAGIGANGNGVKRDGFPWSLFQITTIR